MPLTRGVALVLKSDVEAITHEVGLDKLDDDQGGAATLANALVQATNLLIIDLIDRDKIDPSTISNEVDLKPAAAWLAAYLVLDAQEGDRYTTRAKRCWDHYVEQLRKYRYVSNVAGPGELRSPKGHMLVVHLDTEPVAARPQNTHWPGRRLRGLTRGRP